METLIISFCLLGFVAGFEVIWNVPTFQCSHHKHKMDFVGLLRSYGIKVNDDDTFRGNRVTMFYEDQLGFYPRINGSGFMKNGGIPQLGELRGHKKKALRDLEREIPSKDFDGLGVIDWEAWRPIWEFNWGTLRIYQNESMDLAKRLNPRASTVGIKKTAECQWTETTKSFMLDTLLLAKNSRSKARWCYYLFPDCYNHKGKKPEDFKCPASVRKGNDKLSWLWKESTALCPSIYVYDEHLADYSFEERTWRDNEKLREALRVAHQKAKIYPYINYFDTELIPEREFYRMLAQVAAAGGDGSVIWGGSYSVKTENLCKDLLQYIKDTIGPAALMVARRSDLCSRQVCNDRGRCTFPHDDNAEAWELFKDDKVKSFDATEITCRCSGNYNGQYCEKEINSI